MTVILAGTIRVPPERLADLRPHLRAQVEGSRAEPGCLDYALTEDPLDPGLIRVYEHFVDEAALAVHRASPHMAAWRASWPGLDVGDRRMSSFDVSDYREI
jgi:quinol monooxygenase YgiN